jgi:hypothetical protein
MLNHICMGGELHRANSASDLPESGHGWTIYEYTP